MSLSALTPPQHDPSPIFETYRAMFGSQLLTAAVAHLQVFEQFHDGPLTFEILRERLGLELRPATVLVTGLRAMGFLETDSPEGGAGPLIGHSGRFRPSPMVAEHLHRDAQFDVSEYIGLSANDPGVLAMVKRLRSNRPAGLEKEEEGAAFIFRKDMESAMEKEAAARRFTMALCGRAKNVAPMLAAKLPLHGAERLIDIGGGTGIYTIACLQQNSQLHATVLDRPEVLKVAAEFAAAYGVADRLELKPHDMWSDPLPTGDVYLLSNVLHDWDIPQCEELIHRCRDAMGSRGRVLVHDVFLNDSLDGPLPITHYSTNLFMVTEGRAYSAAEYRAMLHSAGLQAASEFVPTLIHCGVLSADKA